MRVPTANVIIGFDREVMDRLFTQGATYTSLIQELTKQGELDNVLLFDNESNPNFLSFIHTYMSGKMEMKVVFIDPKGEFEKRFLTNSLPRNIAGFSHNTAVYQKNTFDKQVAPPEGADPISEEAKKETKQSQKLYGPEFFAELQKDLSGHYGEKFFYVAYGSGNNLDLWAGPHKTIMTGAEITVKGSRKITLTLSPTADPIQVSHRRGEYNEEVNLNLAGLTMRYSGMSQPIEFTNLIQNPPKAAYDPLVPLKLENLAVAGISGGVVEGIRGEVETSYKNRTDITDALEKIGLSDVSSELKDFDFHSIIVDALRNYVQKATGNPNVIILLPNINVTCRQFLNESLVNARKLVTNLKMASKAPLFGNLVKTLTDYVYNPLLGELGYRENFMSSLLSSFGLELHQVLKQYANSSGELKAIPSHKISALQEYERNTSADKRFKEYFDVYNFYAIVQKASNKGIPNHVEVLKTVIEKINERSKEEYQTSWKIYTETDIKLLDFWAGSIKTLPTHKFSTFGGYKDFKQEREAIIVEDQALIQKYLYGKIDLDNKFKNIQEYEEAAALAQENQNKYEKTSDDIVSSWGEVNNPNDLGEVWDNSQGFNDDMINYQTADEASAYDIKALEQAEIYKAGIIGAVKAIPLHPLDAIILTNKNYNKAVREITLPFITGAGSFGDISDVPDTFGYSDKEMTDNKKDYIKKQGIPIFRYNTTNPNILDLTFKFSGVYLAALKAGFVTAVKRKASAVAEGVLPIGVGSLPIRTRGAAIAYLRQKNFIHDADNAKEIIAGLKGKVSVELMKSLNVAGPAQAADTIAAILENLEKGSDADLKGLIEVDQSLPGNPQSIMTDLAENMYRNALSINIKTLPIFHISNINYMSSPCIVFAQDAPIKQSNSYQEESLLNSFYSGLYRIMGFKHTINTSLASSEFSLVKNQVDFSSGKKEATE